jgi:hypothetical protein
LHNSGFVKGLKNLRSFGNLSLLVPGLEVLEILKVMDIGILVMEILFFIMFSNVYLALILLFSPQLLGSSLPT